MRPPWGGTHCQSHCLPSGCLGAVVSGALRKWRSLESPRVHAGVPKTEVSFWRLQARQELLWVPRPPARPRGGKEAGVGVADRDLEGGTMWWEGRARVTEACGSVDSCM